MDKVGLTLGEGRTIRKCLWLSYKMRKRGGGVKFLGQQMPVLDAEMPFNPFVNRHVSISSNYELAKTLLLLPLFVFRVSVFILLLVVGLVLTKLALLGAREVLNAPLPLWRRKLLWPVRYLARCLLFFCGYHWIGVKGKPARKRDAPVLVCNHVTFVDPVYIFYKHLPVIVTAEENLNYPFMGTIISAMQPITIRRESQESRNKAAVEIRKRAKSLEWKNSLMIFPEGTTTNGKAMVSFKSGAFSSSSPVQPMVVRYPHVHLDPSWVADGPSAYALLFRLMTQFHNYMEIEYLPVMRPSKQENPRSFAERVRAEMARALNVVVTEHTFDDVSMVDAARGASSKLDLLEFGRFERLYRVTPKEAKRFFRKFRALDVQRNGVASEEDLADYLDLPSCEAVSKVYDLFDSKGCGYFNFRQYAAGLLFISRHERFREAAEAVFERLDRDGDGLLSSGDFSAGLTELVPGTSREQAKALWDRINAKQGRFVHRIELLTFLDRNPEYVAVFLFGAPGLLSNVKAETAILEPSSTDQKNFTGSTTDASPGPSV
ncbi:lysophospholipid acyltransferase LPEAT2 [Selaginella moellendorffii]|nr:lysophospholipid acyltransferase LPEAT2 [Selaginella moellendorffii]|eukprot:XP_024530599.1 lysophospholipid acyltransferase LPEAT2 [Selaginella moellendorffii]